MPVSSVLAQPSNVAIQPGYSMTAVATGLNFPTAMTFFGDTIWVTEEGTASAPSAVRRIDNKGNVTTQLTATQLPAGSLVSPLTGIVFNRGWFWLVHRQTNSKNAPGVPVGVISRFKPSDPVGSFQTVIAGFPSFGDHPNSQIVFGANGRAYIKWGRADQLRRRRA
jgi:glucose/arabinose dehydrogenase